MSGMTILLVSYPAARDYYSWCKSLVERGLAACINISKVRSIYYWEGKVQEDDEVLLIIKTDMGVLEKLKETVREEHPYSVPEIVEIRPAEVNEPYLEWVTSSTIRRISTNKTAQR